MVGVAAVAAIVASKAAQAGYKKDYALVCDDSSCHGSMGTVRADANAKTYISVEHYGRSPNLNGTVGWAYIYFRDAAGTTRQCRIGGEHTGLIEAARAITSDSYVDVSWDSSGFCETLVVENSSHLRPKTL